MKIKTYRNLCLYFCILLFSACASHERPIVVPSPSEQAALSDAKPFLGIGYSVVKNLKDLPVPSGISKGLRITHLVPESAAQHAGLRIGDIIVSFDAHAVTETPGGEESASLRDYIKTQKRIGDTLDLEIVRPETTMTARQDEQKLNLWNIDSIGELIAKQPFGQPLTISIDKQAPIRKFNVVLAAKPGILNTPLPDNKLLFPEFETVHDPYMDLSLNLIHDFHLQDTYENILAQFDTDEQWDDGFRLNLFRYIHRAPLRAFTAADQVCDSLEKQVNQKKLPELLKSAAALIDETIEITPDALPFQPTNQKSPDEHFRFIEKTVNTALQYRNQAFQKLSTAEQQFLFTNMQEVLLDSESATLSMTDYNSQVDEPLQKITALAHKIDYPALITTAVILARLADETWLHDFQTSMTAHANNAGNSLPGVQGELLHIINTQAGKLIIGGKGPNRYDIASGMIIDFGGDDIYVNGAGKADKSGLSVIIDCNGNDRYSATEPVSMGSGFLGTGMLIDLAGNDIYTGTSFTQGCGIMGVGVLADFQGNDHYRGQEYNQGIGLWGIGLLLDFTGDDTYSSCLMAQGVGGPKGIGILSDIAGNDQYAATGKVKSSYGTKGIFNGLSQGFGFGFRGYASGGIGILIDADGNNFFQAGNFSQGCGYAYGLGILKNAGHGNDRYLGSRYAQGSSAHSAAGILIDEGGNDHYEGLVGALQGAAWDMGLAVLVDKSGDDTYDSQHLFFSQAAAAHTGLAMFIDQGGADHYRFAENSDRTTNHFPNERNMTFFIDSGGEIDQYNGDIKENDKIRLNGRNSLRIDLDGDGEASLLNDNYRKLIQKTDF